MFTEELKIQLESAFPQYSFYESKRLYGHCIVAKKSKYVGAEVIVKPHKLVITPGIPDIKTRLMLGAGALFVKFFKSDYDEPAGAVFDFLKGKNHILEYRA